MFLDLEYEVRTNGEFQHRLRCLQQEVAHWHRQARRDSDHRGRYAEAVRELIRFCGHNVVLLIPFLWPRFLDERPLTFRDFPFAWPLFQLQFGGSLVVRGSRQIGKSTSFCVRQLLLAQLIPSFKSMYIVPHTKQLQTYGRRLREVERAMVGYTDKHSAQLKKNFAYKEFGNGSTIEMNYVLTSASPVRGKSTDELLFDELQDFDPELEIEVSQIQSASTMPSTIFAGTSLTTDTLLEKKWSESSQGLWVTRCEGCRHDNIPLPEHGVLDSIQPSGPSCCKCSRPINVRTGQFVHGNSGKLEAGYVGLHVPQIILPSVATNPARWAKIYEMKVKKGGDRKFFQEILGIAVEEGEREITRQNLIDLCSLGSDLERLRLRAIQGAYQFVVSGMDWGGSDYIPAQHIKISTTVHVIIGITPDGKFDILHIRRYSGMNYDDIVGHILHYHDACGGQSMASDFGVGAVYNSKLREKIQPEKHLIFNYVGPACDLISEPRKTHIYNQWSLNKMESLSLTFEAIRNKRIRCFAWEFAEEYLTDCLNLFRAPGERQSSGGSNSGASTFLYRSHPSRPNDTCMAINYAYMLGKILLGEPMFADQSLKLRLESTLQSNLYSVNLNLPGAFSG